MRFKVNKTYCFVRFIVSGKNPIDGSKIEKLIKSSYPWFDDHVENKTEFKKLMCLEIHKVPCEFEREKIPKYDGFTFIDPQEKNSTKLWYNQYPTASYGHMSDTANNTVNSIKDVYSFYRLDSMIEELFELYSRNRLKKSIKFEIEKILKQIDEYLDEQDLGIFINFKDIKEKSLVSINIQESNKDSIKAIELISNLSKDKL